MSAERPAKRVSVRLGTGLFVAGCAALVPSLVMLFFSLREPLPRGEANIGLGIALGGVIFSSGIVAIGFVLARVRMTSLARAILVALALYCLWSVAFVVYVLTLMGAQT